MVEPSFNTRQWYGFGELERRRFLRTDTKGRRAEQQNAENLHLFILNGERVFTAVAPTMMAVLAALALRDGKVIRELLDL